MAPRVWLALPALAACNALWGMGELAFEGAGGATATATTSATAGAGGSLGSGGAGGGDTLGSCNGDADCTSSSKCRLPKCADGMCAFTFATKGQSCSDNGGQVCDAVGNCVNGSCLDGLKDGGESDVDCGGGCGACANGKSCKLASDCLSGVCSGGGSCAPCGGTAGCAFGQYCNNGVCAAKKSKGAACGANGECATNHCVAGLCCNGPCTGACEQCGGGNCGPRPKGAAGDPICSPFVCNGAGADCPASCVADADCVAGGYCKVATAKCYASKFGNGLGCTAAADCKSNYCVQGICCASPGCPICNSCATGTCQPVPDQTPCGAMGKCCSGMCKQACQ